MGQGWGLGPGARPAGFFLRRAHPVLLVFIFPFFWMAFNSFKTHEKILEYPPAFVFSRPWTISRASFGRPPF